MIASVAIWRQMLQVAECAPDDITAILRVVPNVRALATVERGDLQELPGWRQSQILLMKEWYLKWVGRGRPNQDMLEAEYTMYAFKEFTYVQSMPTPSAPPTATMTPMEATTIASGAIGRTGLMVSTNSYAKDVPNTTTTTPMAATTIASGANEGTGLIVSNKLDAKDVPKLKAGVPLKGKVFDNWTIAFKVKLESAGCTNIMDPGYTPPTATDPDYATFRVKKNYLASHLVTVTLHSNAYCLIDADNQNGLEMWKSLLEITAERIMCRMIL